MDALDMLLTSLENFGDCAKADVDLSARRNSLAIAFVSF
jgi:hypothetical protein